MTYSVPFSRLIKSPSSIVIIGLILTEKINTVKSTVFIDVIKAQVPFFKEYKLILFLVINIYSSSSQLIISIY